MKREILHETLERARLSHLPEVQTLSGEPLRYRNRVRFHIDRATSKLCYKKRASHSNLAIDICPILAPVLEGALKKWNANSSRWQLGKEFDEVEFFINADESALLITLWTSSQPKAAKAALQRLWPEIEQEMPTAVGAAIYSTDGKNHADRLLATAGETSFTYEAAGRKYRVSAGSFFQVNRLLIDPLVTLVTQEAAGILAWDLYAGVGLFSRALADRFQKVVAVESSPNSLQDLRQNLAGSAHRTVASSTLEFLRRAQASEKEKPDHVIPDYVIVDPPRAGLGKEVTALLAEIRPAHITYVSCDPATLSRDLKSLLDSGYFLDRLHMVDMFPQTFHLESVAVLSLH
jgi:23S rRNA (uracil1939-C5)-methyltransferase